MSGSLLSQEERSVLEFYVNRNISGAAYFNRARILILADQGLSQELIAVETGVSITRVRQMLRAFDREGLKLFPADLMALPPYYPDDPITRTGYVIMDRLLNKIESLETELVLSPSVLGVHEARKTMRRMRTALRLFAPYFPNLPLKKYRKRFRKAMRLMAPSRDTAVFLGKLENHVKTSEMSESLSEERLFAFEELNAYWQSKRIETDEKLSENLAQEKNQKLLSDCRLLLDSMSMASIEERQYVGKQSQGPIKTRHVAPLLMIEKITKARAFSDDLTAATPQTLHALRISMKELRYTLEFFQPIMGNSAANPIDTVKELLTHLGDLNDARVHLNMLLDTQSETASNAIALYTEVKEKELAQLMEEFKDKWLLFESPEWRLPLAQAMAVL